MLSPWGARLRTGENRLPCPQCDRGPRDRALSVRVDPDGAVLWYCHRCQWAGHERGRTIPLSSSRPPRPAADHQTYYSGLSGWARELWGVCQPIAGEARDYLEARRCVIPPCDGDLRWHPELKHPLGHVGAGLVALVTDALTRTPMNLHRTWIRADGRKADVDRPRRVLPRHHIRGGVIRLWPNEVVTVGLGLGEGIESALSAAHAFMPMWSALDAGNLGVFPVLAGIEALRIFVDHDAAGITGAEACARRWAAAGREVGLVVPDAGKDWNNEVNPND